LVEHGVKGEGEVLAKVLWVRDLDNVVRLAWFSAVGADNHVLVQLRVQERTYASHDADRHDGEDDVLYWLVKERGWS
jgi:hypothetical protein